MIDDATRDAETPSNDPPIEELRHSLRVHLEGLESWGVSRIFGEPLLASAPEAAATAPTPAVEAEPPAPRDPRPASQRLEDPRPASQRLSDPPPAARKPVEPTSPAPAAPPPDKGEPAEILAAIAAEVAACTRCGLSKTRNLTVPGVGDPRARLMFVGEAPGAEEDRRGEPFVGRAGELLDKIIGALGFRREEVFIANTLKCRPPNNRDPLPDESGACTPFLERQVRAIAPRQIVALGRPAARFLTGRDEPLSRLRGGKHSFLGVPVVVTYHPAYLLRNPAAKADCWHDLQAVVREFPERAPPKRG